MSHYSTTIPDVINYGFGPVSWLQSNHSPRIPFTTTHDHSQHCDAASPQKLISTLLQIYSWCFGAGNFFLEYFNTTDTAVVIRSFHCSYPGRYWWLNYQLTTDAAHSDYKCALHKSMAIQKSELKCITLGGDVIALIAGRILCRKCFKVLGKNMTRREGRKGSCQNVSMHQIKGVF